MKRQVLKDRGIIYRYPKVFFALFTTTGLLLFASKPIFDSYYYKPTKDNIELELDIRKYKSKFHKD